MTPHILKHFGKYVVALSLVLVGLFAIGCVTAEDTQKTADAHQTFETKREDVTTRLAAGAITSEQAVAELQAAVNELKAKLAEIGKGVGERTRGFFSDPEAMIGSALSTVLGMFALNVKRNSAEQKKWGTPEQAEAQLEELKRQLNVALAKAQNAESLARTNTSPTT